MDFSGGSAEGKLFVFSLRVFGLVLWCTLHDLRTTAVTAARRIYVSWCDEGDSIIYFPVPGFIMRVGFPVYVLLSSAYSCGVYYECFHMCIRGS